MQLCNFCTVLLCCTYNNLILNCMITNILSNIPHFILILFQFSTKYLIGSVVLTMILSGCGNSSNDYQDINRSYAPSTVDDQNTSNQKPTLLFQQKANTSTNLSQSQDLIKKPINYSDNIFLTADFLNNTTVGYQSIDTKDPNNLEFDFHSTNHYLNYTFSSSIIGSFSIALLLANSLKHIQAPLSFAILAVSLALTGLASYRFIASTTNNYQKDTISLEDDLAITFLESGLQDFSNKNISPIFKKLRIFSSKPSPHQNKPDSSIPAAIAASDSETKSTQDVKALSLKRIDMLYDMKKNIDIQLNHIYQNIQALESSYVNTTIYLNQFVILRYYSLLRESLFDPQNSHNDHTLNYIRIATTEYLTHFFWKKHIDINDLNDHFNWKDMFSLSQETYNMLIKAAKANQESLKLPYFYNKSLDEFIHNTLINDSFHNLYHVDHIKSIPSLFPQIMIEEVSIENDPDSIVNSIKNYINKAEITLKQLNNRSMRLYRNLQINKLVVSIEDLYIQKYFFDNKLNEELKNVAYEDYLSNHMALKSIQLRLTSLFQKHIDSITSILPSLNEFSQKELYITVQNLITINNKILDMYESAQKELKLAQ